MHDKNIKSILEIHFPKLTGTALTDAINVSDKFSKGPKSKNVMKGLEVLEKKFKEAGNEKHKMRRVLGPVEGSAGINIDVTGNVVPTVLRPLSSDEGHALLRQRRIWKDPGIDAGSGGHGEHTHRFQWFILITQKLTKTSPDEFLHIVADQTGGGQSGHSLWDCLFDRLAEQGNEDGAPPFKHNKSDDFRCPERLNAHISQNPKLYPGLSAAIKGRNTKRDDSRGLNGLGAYQNALVTGLRKVLGQEVGPNDTITTAHTNFIRANDNLFKDSWRHFTTAVHYALTKEGFVLDETTQSIVPRQGQQITREIVERVLAQAIAGHLERRF